MVNGNLVQSYVICPRQAWLFSRNLIPDQEHPFIELGRLIDSESYKRDRKKIHLENLVLDIIKTDGPDIIVGEVKKSSKAAERGRVQLLFYLSISIKRKGYRGKRNALLS
jgi:CRISPR-associated exonuclease Cas4